MFLISAITGLGLDELVEEIMQHVQQRRQEMIDAGEEAPVLRQTQRPSTGKKRVPPHLAGPTAQLSNDLQAKDVDEDAP